ncbi:MAG TPA: N-acetylmuramoyl-L-alanine amidase [Candidatus Scybalocola faecavium]|nr:N-acetylmuramoyl-L-alanine amidase [Candidatus Scybalocola faecavium]
MEKKPKNGIRNILLGVIGVLLLVLGIVIGLIIAGILSDRPLIGGAQESQEHVQITGETLEESFESETDKMTDRQDDTGETVAQETRESVPETEPIRIVLDPGHDDYCSRNHPDLGVNEQDLNLKIALACRDELETYEGVEVFMTREDGSCPDNGQGSDDVTGRTAYAGSVDADLFVSLHNNATGLGYPSEANGAEVYITVYSKFTDESRKLGESILSELTTQVDLANRGVLTRVKADKGYYDDGNTKDWYYLISTCIDQGFPGIIIEHSFMDNPHDNALLKDDSQLQAMGVADAAGIAHYFGLEKKE